MRGGPEWPGDESNLRLPDLDRTCSNLRIPTVSLAGAVAGAAALAGSLHVPLTGGVSSAVMISIHTDGLTRVGSGQIAHADLRR